MDQQDQREQFKVIVEAAMARKAWSQAMLAKEAGVSEGTVTRVMQGKTIRPTQVGKLRRALGIEPLAAAQAAEGYGPVIDAVRDTVGMVLRDLPPDQLAPAISRVIKALMAGEVSNNGHA